MAKSLLSASGEDVQKQVIDREAALNFVCHDHRMLSDLVETFRDYYPSMLERIGKAIELKDAAELREAAHQFKGAISNFHAQAAFNTAYDLEIKGRNVELDSAAPIYDSLTQDVKILFDSLVELLEDISPNS